MSNVADPSQYEDDQEHMEEEQQQIGTRFLWLTAVPSWLVSLVVHLVIILVFLTIYIDIAVKEKRVLTIDDTSDAEEIEEFIMEEFEPIDMQTLEFDKPPEQPEDAVVAEEIVMSDFNEMEAATMQQDLVDFAENTAPVSDLLTSVAGVSGNATSGRGKASRTQMLTEGGGNGASERAVVKGIEWIADHQLSDGSWNFDHRQAAKKPGSKNWGSASKAVNGATGLALLPFLGSGHTHKEGKFKGQVELGLRALGQRMKFRGQEGSFHEPEGTMYSHGIAAITLCEAYAMTQDEKLRIPAQASLNFIVTAQDPVGGGWRYNPRQAGDTSAVGWQIMALKSGHMGYLEVPKNTVQGAIKFLDGVASGGGAYYGYAEPGKKASTTSVGLLCRMYLGWKKDNPALTEGVTFLSKTGPDKNNMYYNYYATQVMRQYGGPMWDKWNKEMRDYLIDTQVPEGQPEDGSWHFSGGHGERGGRLYNTALAVLTLEVYYRHLPIYKKEASEEDFPL